MIVVLLGRLQAPVSHNFHAIESKGRKRAREEEYENPPAKIRRLVSNCLEQKKKGSKKQTSLNAFSFFLVQGNIKRSVKVRRDKKVMGTGLASLSKTRKKKTKRSVTSFSSNLTISRGNSSPQLSEREDSCSMDFLQGKVNDKEFLDRVEDHCSRRVVLFYYLLLIYYKEGCQVDRAQTDLQHGAAKCGYCHAAHSSILPHVQDDFFYHLSLKIRDQGVNSSIEEKLLSLGFSKGTLEKIKILDDHQEIISTLFSEEMLEGKKGLIPYQAPFYQAMNSTVELDARVDIYDTLIEGVMRPKALEILNWVSKGEGTPFEGVEAFIREMKSFFTKSRDSTQKKLELLDQFEKVEKDCRFLEEKLKYSSSGEYREVMQDFVKSLFSYRSIHKQIQDLDEYSINLRLYKRMNSYRAIYKRLWEIYYGEKKKVERLFGGGLRAYAKSLKKYFRLPRSYQRKLSGLARIEKDEELQGLILSFFKERDLSEFLMFFQKDEEYPLEFVWNQAKERSLSDLPSLQVLREELEGSLKIIDLQELFTELPKYELLSGKLEKENLVGMTPEELLQEKMRIIRHQYSFLFQEEG